MSKQKQLAKDLTRGSIPKRLLFLTLPFMAANALQVLYSTIDMIVVGYFVKTPGLSAVSQSSQILNFATMICFGFSNAGQILIAQALGAGKKKEMNRIIGTMFSLLMILALILTAVILGLQDWILETMNIPLESKGFAREYLII